MNVLNQPVLCLNSTWSPLSTKTVKEALIAMLGGAYGGSPAALAIDAEFAQTPEGDVDWNTLVYAQPVKWEDWIKLPIRPGDIELHSCNLTIRAPRVIIQPNYSKMPTVTPRPTKESIRKRDGSICQYTGRPVSWKDSNIDHVIPRSRGGKNTFENLVLVHKDVNSKKADRTPEEAGLKLIRKPVAPKPVPVNMLLTSALHPSWIPFMTNVKEVRK